MKYVVQMAEADHFARWEAASAQERAAVLARFDAFTAAVAERGSVVGGEGLDRPSQARTLRPGPGRPVTDGPFAETTEQLGGFFVIDVPDIDVAVELARLLPEAWTIEVRPVVDG